MFNRWIEEKGPSGSSLLEVLEEEGIGCIPFSPLAQGLLTDKYLADSLPADSRAASPTGFLRPEHVTEEKLARVRKLNEIATARGQTMAQMALAWVLRHKTVTSALIGASKVSQVEDSVGALDNLAFSDEELQAIEAVLAG
jgi:L-glyceraldehyde 3-phosphate reductase